MSTKIDKEVKQKMQQALAAYKKNKNSAKEFYPCTQQLTAWLQMQER